MNESNARSAAREIFNYALNAVNVYEAVSHAIRLSSSRLSICEEEFDISSRNVYAVAVGKAAPTMAEALNVRIGERLDAGVLSGPYNKADRNLSGDRWQRFNGGHPLPSEQSLAAADAAFELLRKANDERALVIFLVSGGGSAMMESPISSDITLGDLRETNRILISCGASIAEINSVRAAISGVKASRLARRASNCEQVTLIISDTNEGDEGNVASGPTIPVEALHSKALEVVRKYALWSHLPESVTAALKSHTDAHESSSTLRRTHHVLLSNRTALEAAAEKAKQLGFGTRTAFDICEQPIDEGCRLLLDEAERLFQDAGQRRVCLISGGEFSCPVKGAGIGGRNSETVLRCAAELGRRSGSRDRGVTILSAGTDGIDGNSPAAGAIADETTIERATAKGLNAHDFIARSDAFTFFDALGDAIVTGATGTNVRDLRLILMPSN